MLSNLSKGKIDIALKIKEAFDIQVLEIPEIKSFCDRIQQTTSRDFFRTIYDQREHTPRVLR
jgi:hypothetical protein